MSTFRWIRPTEGAVIAGVCACVARNLDVNPWVVRILFLATAIFGGLGLLVYVLGWIALPREDGVPDALNPKILGVCARIHRRGDIEVGLARLIAMILLVFSFGAAIVGYIVLHFVLDRNDR